MLFLNNTELKIFGHYWELILYNHYSVAFSLFVVNIFHDFVCVCVFVYIYIILIARVRVQYGKIFYEHAKYFHEPKASENVA